MNPGTFTGMFPGVIQQTSAVKKQIFFPVSATWIVPRTGYYIVHCIGGGGSGGRGGSGNVRDVELDRVLRGLAGGLLRVGGDQETGTDQAGDDGSAEFHVELSPVGKRPGRICAVKTGTLLRRARKINPLACDSRPGPRQSGACLPPAPGPSCTIP